MLSLWDVRFFITGGNAGWIDGVHGHFGSKASGEKGCRAPSRVETRGSLSAAVAIVVRRRYRAVGAAEKVFVFSVVMFRVADYGSLTYS